MFIPSRCSIQRAVTSSSTETETAPLLRQKRLIILVLYGGALAILLIQAMHNQSFVESQPHFALPASNASMDAFTSRVRRIYSAGQTRSGSTFQFTLLCVIAHLRSSSVSCSLKPAQLQVIKLHPSNQVFASDGTSMFFTTLRHKNYWKQINVSWAEGTRVSYEQHYSELERCPLCEISKYEDIFDLTSDEVLQITQYMRYWSILRQCCGSQMSKWFRGELFGCQDANGFSIEGRLDFHMCGSMNLTAVEEHFESTHLYSLVPASALATTNNLQYLWSKKGDCEKSHNAIRSGIGFNLKPVDKHICRKLKEGFRHTV